MEQTEILDGSKIICVFMDGEVMDDGMCWFWGHHHVRTTNKCFHIKAVKYHSSWDWLMPVVEKIESSKVDNWPEPIKSFTFRIESKYCLISGHSGIAQPGVFYQTPYGYEPESKIHATWLAVVGFIKWYNSLKS